jgi:2-polyprenyl-3-methyl-5-hydroxy-6-metoxy-1,4-benzoquinol methylase
MNNPKTHYENKLAFISSHSFAVKNVPSGSLVLEFGSGPGFVGKALAEKGCAIYGFEKTPQNPISGYKEIRTADLDNLEVAVENLPGKVDYILLLDILEHLDAPENFLDRLRRTYAHQRPLVIITTGNIAFFSIRLGLLFGQFEYRERGILDITHKRLFTCSSRERTLKNAGLEILEVNGIPAPFPLVVKNKTLSGILLRLNSLLIFFFRNLFSFQMGIIARLEEDGIK